MKISDLNTEVRKEVKINGSMGEGGGQVLRTALTLAMCTGVSLAISDIRAGRRKPGLMRQHLAALRAAQVITDAQITGDELGSCQVTFRPGAIRAGDYEFHIGSAGSTTLLMQTILPALAFAGGRSTVTVHGGTHNGMAPSVDFIELAYLPLLARMGIAVHSNLSVHGFYPNGGGVWQVSIEPWSKMRPLSLMHRGELVARKAVAISSNLPEHVARRELARVEKKLRWQPNELEVLEVPGQGSGNIVSLRCTHEFVTEVFEAVGTIGHSAERVAGLAIRGAKHYEQGDYVVGEYLADQLLLPMSLGKGGEFTTCALSEHSTTSMKLIEQMLEAKLFEVIDGDARGQRCSTIRIQDGLALTC